MEDILETLSFLTKAPANTGRGVSTYQVESMRAVLFHNRVSYKNIPYAELGIRVFLPSSG